MEDVKLQPLGALAFQLTPYDITMSAQAAPNEESADVVHGFAYDLATILALPVANSDDIPEHERLIPARKLTLREQLERGGAA